MTTAVPNLDPEAVKASHLAIAVEVREASELVIEDPETYAAVGAILIERLKQYDAAKDFRDKVTKPVYAHWKYLCDLLSVKPHEDLIKALKGAIKAYDLREDARKRLAAEEARALFAAPTPDIPAMTQALTVANAPEAQADGVSTTFVWKVKRIIPDLLPDAYWIPDEAGIAQVARDHKGDDPPVIPGVVFERDAQVTGRRK